MPAFLVAWWLKTATARARIGEFLRAHWKPIAAVALLALVISLAFCAGGNKQKAKDAVKVEQAQQQTRTADAITKVEKARTEVTGQIASTAVEARKAQAPDRVASETRSRQDAAAIASAPQDPMVSAGGPLDRMFGGSK